MSAMYNNSKPKFLDQLVANGKLTADGRDWLTLALDPFHDQNHQAAGYPDADGSQTLVSCYQYQLDLTCPAGVAGNWDAHVYTMPITTPALYVLGNELATWTSAFESAGPLVTPLGPLCIAAVPSGVALSPIAPIPANSYYQCLPYSGTQDLSAGVTRVIGLAYEVTNTTAEMYKQGSVTTYRMPQFSSKVGDTLVHTSPAARIANLATSRWRKPPTTVAEANLLKGTRTWDAAAGVYATAVQNCVSNPLSMVHGSAVIFEPAATTGSVNDIYISPYQTFGVAAPPAVSACAPYVTQTIPFDTTGSMFTGLSPNTTLTVKLKVYIERAPTFAEANLAVLATPSAGLDNIALELYSHAISQLPVAVTVGENGLGDWFRGVVRVLRDVAGGATSLLGPIVPGAQQVGTAAQTILGRMDSWMNKPRAAPSISNQSKPRPKMASQNKKKKTKLPPKSSKTRK